MSDLKTFAGIAAGNIGALIVHELLREKAEGEVSSVLVFTCSQETKNRNSHPKWVSQGVVFTAVNYDDPLTYKSTFEGIDLVISTIPEPTVPKQQPLAEAAKASGVKLFVPAEFGNPTDHAKESLWLERKRVQEKLREINLPYALFFTGLWTDFIFFLGAQGLRLGFDQQESENRGIWKLSHHLDCARRRSSFVVHVLTKLPMAELERKIFRLEGQCATFNEVTAIYERNTGNKLDVSYIPLDVLKKNVEEDRDDYPSLCLYVWDHGEGQVGEPSNPLWPEWNSKSIDEVLST